MKGEQSNLSTGRVGNREARVIEDDGARGGVGSGTRKDRQSTVQGNKSQQKKLMGKGGMETRTNNSLSRLSSIPRGSHRSGVALAPRLLLVLLVRMGRRAEVRRAEVTIQGVVARRSRRGAGAVRWTVRPEKRTRAGCRTWDGSDPEWAPLRVRWTTL